MRLTSFFMPTLLCIILLPAVAIAQAVEGIDKVFAVDFTLHMDGTVDVNGLSLTDGVPNTGRPLPGEYYVRLSDEDGKELLAEDLTTDFEFHGIKEVPCEEIGLPPSSGENGMCLTDAGGQVESIEVSLRIPYYKEAEKLEFLYKGRVMASVDIPQMVCKSDEMCEDYCRTRGDPDCPVITPPKGGGGGKNVGGESRFPFELLIIFVALVALLVFFVLRKRKKSTGWEGGYAQTDTV